MLDGSICTCIGAANAYVRHLVHLANLAWLWPIAACALICPEGEAASLHLRPRLVHLANLAWLWPIAACTCALICQQGKAASLRSQPRLVHLTKLAWLWPIAACALICHQEPSFMAGMG